MRKLSGTLKLDLAQYRELEAFAKFGSDLDAATLRQLKRGERTVELMKQGEFEPLPVENQIALLKVNDEGLLDRLPVEKVGEFEENFLQAVQAKYEKQMKELGVSGLLNDELAEGLLKIASTVIDQLTVQPEVEA